MKAALQGAGALLLLLGTSCSHVTALSHHFRSTDRFESLAAEERVLVEPGAEALGGIVAQHLADALRLVEERQRMSFPREIRIYACAGEGSFRHMTGRSTRALTFRGAVFISPRLMETPELIPPYLAHELSHLALLHHLGLYRYLSTPPWFSEGLAVLVSGGAGAQEATEEAAFARLAEGRHFVPEAGGGAFDFLSPRYGRYWSLEPHLFYRQSAMFVAHMREYDGRAFAVMLSELGRGRSFHSSYGAAYEEPLEELWGLFMEQVRAREGRSPGS